MSPTVAGLAFGVLLFCAGRLLARTGDAREREAALRGYTEPARVLGVEAEKCVLCGNVGSFVGLVVFAGAAVFSVPA